MLQSVFVSNRGDRMLNHNRAPKLLAFGTAVALGLSACTGQSGNTESSATPSTKPSYIGDNIPPKDLTTCKGKLGGFKPGEPSWTKDGNVYEVTSISDGPCAGVYDLATLKDFGGLAVGDVNLTEAGLEQVNAHAMPSCASEGIPDKGLFTHN